MGDVVAATGATWLFVPGSRPDRFAKAVSSGADEVILDLEDAVSPADKASAREAVAAWLDVPARGADSGAGPGRGSAWVRINPPGSAWYDADVAALFGSPGLRGVVVPKAEDPDALTRLRVRLGRAAPLLALVETAQGVHRAAAIAAAHGVCRLAFGAIDLALDLGAVESRESLLLARSQIVLASRVAGLPAPIDGVTADVGELDAVVADTAYAKGLGFGGKLCIHPAQVPVVARVLTPSAEEVAWAREVLAAAEAAGAGVARARGAMVDLPVYERARRVLVQAGVVTSDSEEAGS